MTIARKKPVAVEARQWTGGPAAATPIIDWILDGGHTATWDQAHVADDGRAIPEQIHILGLGSAVAANPGDWIVRAHDGFHPYGPDAFADSYDLEPFPGAFDDGPRRAPLMGQLLQSVDSFEAYSGHDGRLDTDDIEQANTIASLVLPREDHSEKPPIAREKHKLILDLDHPAMLIPSTTPGHSHLYVDVEISWERYAALLLALAEAGVIERGYADASLARGFTSVRLPWVKKEKPDALKLGTDLVYLYLDVFKTATRDGASIADAAEHASRAVAVARTLQEGSK